MNDVSPTPAAEPTMEEILSSIRKIIADDTQAPAHAGDGHGAPSLAGFVAGDDEEIVLSDVADEPPPRMAEFTTTSEHGLAPEVHADAAPAPQHLPEPEPLHPTAAALAPEVQKQMPPGGMAMVPVAEDKKTLISETVSHVAASALATLAQQVEKVEATMHPATYLGNGQKTLEDMVMEQLRPMLRSWLDDNLPPMVERLVEREIQRISRRTAD